MLPRRRLSIISTSTRRIIQGAGQNVMRNARKQNTAKRQPRISSAKGSRMRPATAKKRSDDAKCRLITQTAKTHVVQWQQTLMVSPMILSPQTTNGNGKFLLPVPPAPPVLPAANGLTNRRARKNAKRSQMAQFRFQPFKKCFNVNCSTMLVPGDFKPCSPRRMFCSQECFEAHWREKLYAHGPATDQKESNRPIVRVAHLKSKTKRRKSRPRSTPRETSIIQFPLCQKAENHWRNQGLLRGAAGL